MQQELLYKGILSYRGDDCEVFLFPDRITWENISILIRIFYSGGLAKFTYIYGSKSKQISKSKVGFSVLGINFKKNKPSLVDISFLTNTIEDANEWVNKIKNELKNHWKCPLPRKPLYIIVNPFSGKKQGTKLYNSIVKEMLDSADIQHEIIMTERSGHAKEIASKLDISKWSAVATISGDGLLHEVLQGLMDRPDWEKAIKIPLGLLPAGSGNGLMKSFNCSGINYAVFNLIKGYTSPLDIFSLSFNSDKKNEYCHLAVFWGLLADADIESDKYRWLGPARFTVGAVVRMVNLRSYHGILRYLPAQSENEEIIIDVENSDANKGDCPVGWKEVKTDFVLFCASNVPWIATDLCIAPSANHKDGCVDLLWIEKGVAKSELGKLMLLVEKGEHIDHPNVVYEKAKAFSLTPTHTSIIDVDGEPLPSQPFTCEILPSLVNLITPSQELEQTL